MNIKKLILNSILYGILVTFMWFIVLFLLSIVFSFDTEIPIIAGIVFAILMPLVIYFLTKLFKVDSIKEAFIYSISWTIITLLIVLLITIPNGTTKIIFTNPLVYLVFITMMASPIINIVAKKK